MRVYDRQNTGRPPRVRWALAEADAPYEVVVLTREETDGAAHHERHPLGRVPVLETDDGTLFESAALCLQVADLYPEAELIPPVGSFERGEVYQWAVFAMSELEPATLRLYRAEQADAAEEAATAREHLANVYGAIEQRLKGSEYLVGDRFGIADVVVGGVLLMARRIKVGPQTPNLTAYLARLDGRPAKQAAFAG